MSAAAAIVEESYDAYGAAAALFDRGPTANEILLSGPAGTGKSRAVLEYLNWLCTEYPDLRCLMVRKTRRSLTESGMVTLERKVLNMAAQGVKWQASQQRYSYPNGSIIAVAGMDKPGKIMSSEWDIVYVQEATELSEAEWEACTTRLRNGKLPWQQMLGDCNPDAPTHWILQRANVGKLLMLNSLHADNPSVTPEYLQRLSELTGVRRQRLYLGLWAAAEGMVYEDAWDRARCLLPRSQYATRQDLRGDCGIDPTWPRYMGIDWGYRNPACIKWYARQPDGDLLVYREMYETMRLVEDLAREALEVMGWKRSETGALLPTRVDADPLPREIIADHDAEDRATFERHFGMSVYPADKGKDSISDGIQAVTRRLQDGRLRYLEGSLVRRDPLLDAAKRPCSSVEEFESYIWDTRAGRPPKEQPIDDCNHGMDVDRYAVTYFDRETLDAGYITFSAPGWGAR